MDIKTEAIEDCIRLADKHGLGADEARKQLSTLLSKVKGEWVSVKHWFCVDCALGSGFKNDKGFPCRAGFEYKDEPPTECPYGNGDDCKWELHEPLPSPPQSDTEPVKTDTEQKCPVCSYLKTSTVTGLNAKNATAQVKSQLRQRKGI